MSRRATRGCALLAAGAVAFAGCGSSHKKDALDRYVEKVNAVQQQAAPQFERANTAFREFGTGKLKGRKAAFDLREAELAIADARRAVVAVAPPPQARHLRDLVERVFTLNILMAADTRQMAVYEAQSKRVLAPLPPLRKLLRKRLGSGAPPADQVRALRAYADAVERIRGRLNRLHAPGILDSSQQTQDLLLRRAGPLARRLAAAIERRDPAAVKRLIRQFRAAGVSPRERAGLQRGSIVAYRQRLQEIDRAGAEARSELARLVRARQ